MMDIQDPIKTTVEELRKVLNIENVIGEVIESEDKIMIPVTRMGMAFGAGMGDGKGSANEGFSAGASGGGAGIEPVAMVVVFKGQSGPEGVKVLPLKNPDPLSRAIGEVSTAIVEVMAEGKKMGMGKKHTKKHTEKAKTEEKMGEAAV
ncbi:GerW family sporulation protein [Methanobacterium sp.]|uniref:GerW family sporulation protein n=1 Tax=Methanobacterium sp. TaxID=2164 RepID=UPI002AB8445C|nr:spore germination protein GerW family protein [Methanobacterium sp.]MDY9922243.1 spore germination protein GerW family protein [Methanobacterium sp.]